MSHAATSASGDYDILSIQLIFPSGSEDNAEMCASVSVNSDNLVEFEEDFTIMLSLVTFGASLNLGNNASAVILTDSDGTLESFIMSESCYKIFHFFHQLRHFQCPMCPVWQRVILH